MMVLLNQNLMLAMRYPNDGSERGNWHVSVCAHSQSALTPLTVWRNGTVSVQPSEHGQVNLHHPTPSSCPTRRRSIADR